MFDKTATITAPARIHFGLMSVSANDNPRFGGMGMMVGEPSVTVRITPAEKLTIGGHETELVRQIIRTWFDAFQTLVPTFSDVQDLPLRVVVEKSPFRHSGFGSGTQLSLAISNLIFHAFDLPIPVPTNFAQMMKRGARSAIGSYGFFEGGILIDSGRSSGHEMSKLDARMDFPDTWRVVLITPVAPLGAHGNLENRSFDELTRTKVSHRQRLVQLCNQEIVPAFANEDYESVGEPLHLFNRLSGSYFSDYQHGCYHSQLCTQIVADVREYGISAVGQSSWGPTIFAITKDQSTAEELVAHLQNLRPDVYRKNISDIQITTGNNQGAVITEQKCLNNTIR